MNVLIGHARGGDPTYTPGDQTGGEVRTQAWFDFKPDFVLRAKDPAVREKMAWTCEAVCANDEIGYSQKGRNQLWAAAVKVNWVIEEIRKPADCDCSSLMAFCAEAAGVKVNIPYGTAVQREGDYLTLNGQRICTDTSKHAHEFFSQDDDGKGQERGKLVGAITAILNRRDAARDTRWGKVWNSALCQKYKRPEHEEVWLWSHDFFNAPVEDLRHIAALVGAKA